MARNRLADANRTYGDQSAPQQSAYPPPSNAVIGQSRGTNPYAQQNVEARPAQAGYNDYAPPQQSYPQQSYGAEAANPYAQQQYGQSQYGQQQGYSQGGVGPNGPASGTDFFSEVTSTSSNLSQLEEMIQAVRQAHQQSLTSTNPQASANADRLNDQARAQREACKNQVKQLFKLAKGDKQMKNQANMTKTRFTSLLTEHQLIEKEYRKKLKDQMERQYRIVNPAATEEEVREASESDNPQVFSQALLNSNRYGAARGAYREVQERHVEIQKIEKSITELAQMFSEMSMLVEQQDDAIGEVERTTQNVNTDVGEGLKQTERAVDSARKARRKKWICFWICVLIVCIVALVLGLYFGLKKN